VGVLVVAGCLAVVGWTEARREVHVLCSLMSPGTPRAEVERILGTARMLELQPAGVPRVGVAPNTAPATAPGLRFTAPATLRTAACDVELGGTGVVGSTLTPGVALDRVAAIGAAGLFLYLTLFQIGLAIGLVPGRLAWGGRHETLPTELRRASALTAPLMPLLAWLLLERAGVVDVVGADGVIAAAAWAVPLLFVLSAAGNLASASPGERRLGIPVTAALVVLSVAVAYGG
ncbi:MAG TPA: hypothetical protein VJ925_04250, partial [Longimicrobiales bacterium]|nr:hypothetical protein [Longimicrobiales bacterium]